MLSAWSWGGGGSALLVEGLLLLLVGVRDLGRGWGLAVDADVGVDEFFGVSERGDSSDLARYRDCGGAHAAFSTLWMGLLLDRMDCTGAVA